MGALKEMNMVAKTQGTFTGIKNTKDAPELHG